MLIFGLDEDTFAQGSMWVVNFIYFLGVFPQIRMNFRSKSAKGFSGVSLYGYVLAYVFQITYTYSLDMPRSYKVMLPIALCAVLILLAQRIYYAPPDRKRIILRKYTPLVLLALALIPIARYNPPLVGMYAGWIAMFVWTVYMLPQGLKMYATKSVVGFSFAYATFMSVGSLLETTSAWLLSNGDASFWPLIYNGIRGMTGYMMFCVQFFLYGRK